MDETKATTSEVEALAKVWDDLADTPTAQSTRRAGFYMANAAVIRQLAKERDEAKEKLRRAKALIGLLTIRQVISAGDAAIEAAGLNPYCINEGQATGDEPIPTWWLDP